jgi:transcriptional antiterminator Rof (Rho-off)
LELQVSTEPCVASIGLKGVYGWTKQHSMDVLLEQYPDLMLDAIKSITHYCQDTDYMLLACKFLRLTLESEKGISFLMRLPDLTLEHFVAKVASLLVVEEYSLGHQVTKIFTGHWNPFVQKVVGWYEYACQGDLEEEEERSSSSTASSVSGWVSWFGGATPVPTKATEPRPEVFAPGSGAPSIVKCSLGSVKCSLDGVTCSPIGVKCSHNGVKCSLNDVKRSLNGVKCSLNGAKCSLNGVNLRST